MDQPEGQSCVNCRYVCVVGENLEDIKNPRVYACKRMPPTASRVAVNVKGGQQIQAHTCWPTVSERVWCHEWAPEPGEGNG